MESPPFQGGAARSVGVVARSRSIRFDFDKVRFADIYKDASRLYQPPRRFAPLRLRKAGIHRPPLQFAGRKVWARSQHSMTGRTTSASGRKTSVSTPRSSTITNS